MHIAAQKMINIKVLLPVFETVPGSKFHFFLDKNMYPSKFCTNNFFYISDLKTALGANIWNTHLWIAASPYSKSVFPTKLVYHIRFWVRSTLASLPSVSWRPDWETSIMSTSPSDVADHADKPLLDLLKTAVLEPRRLCILQARPDVHLVQTHHVLSVLQLTALVIWVRVLWALATAWAEGGLFLVYFYVSGGEVSPLILVIQRNSKSNISSNGTNHKQQ